MFCLLLQLVGRKVAINWRFALVACNMALLLVPRLNFFPFYRCSILCFRFVSVANSTNFIGKTLNGELGVKLWLRSDQLSLAKALSRFESFVVSDGREVWCAKIYILKT